MAIVTALPSRQNGGEEAANREEDGDGGGGGDNEDDDASMTGGEGYADSDSAVGGCSFSVDSMSDVLQYMCEWRPGDPWRLHEGIARSIVQFITLSPGNYVPIDGNDFENAFLKQSIFQKIWPVLRQLGVKYKKGSGFLSAYDYKFPGPFSYI
jgi:hypothetical protein